jgi:hypothetical protein
MGTVHKLADFGEHLGVEVRPLNPAIGEQRRVGEVGELAGVARAAPSTPSERTVRTPAIASSASAASALRNSSAARSNPSINPRQPKWSSAGAGETSVTGIVPCHRRNTTRRYG